LYSAVSLKLPTRYRPTCDATVGNNMFYGHYEINVMVSSGGGGGGGGSSSSSSSSSSSILLTEMQN